MADSTSSGRTDTTGTDWDAATYDRIADPQMRWGVTVLERLALRGDETVLDAGCGSGRVTEKLLGQLPGGRVVALDASATMLVEARRRLERFSPRVDFVQCDLLELGPDSLHGAAPVDAVFSTATFHWVLDHALLFANVAAVLAPGGQLVAQCGGEGNISGLMEAIRTVGGERAGTWLYASPSATVSRLEAAGFVDIEVWTNPEPTRFEPGEELETFLEKVCLRAHLAELPDEERSAFVHAVAAALGEPVIDYVRLNILARMP